MAPHRNRHSLSVIGGAALAIAALTIGAAPARAAEPLGIEPPSPSPPAPEGIEQAVVARYWEYGRPRTFLATTLDAGYLYVRPRFAVGYGLPYWRWIGVEAYPLMTLGGLGQYAGIGAAVPGFTIRAGGRYWYPLDRSWIAPQPDNSFSRTDIEVLRGPTGNYLALEAEATGTIPLPAGSLFLVLTGYHISMKPDPSTGEVAADPLLGQEGYYLYEESLRAVMKPPWIWRARLGYLAAFGPNAAIRIGPAGDLIGLPGRSKYIVRAGLVASVAINAHLEAQASFVPVIVSPDTLGVAGGDFGQLGIRVRWATGSEPDPEALKKARAKRLEELRQEQQLPPVGLP